MRHLWGKGSPFHPRRAAVPCSGPNGMKHEPVAAQTHAMNSLINLLIVLLIVGWLVGFIGFHAMVGNLIHILLIVAVIAIVFRLISGRKSDL